MVYNLGVIILLWQRWRWKRSNFLKNLLLERKKFWIRY